MKLIQQLVVAVTVVFVAFIPPFMVPVPWLTGEARAFDFGSPPFPPTCPDSDGDGFTDPVSIFALCRPTSRDNCPTVFNPSQTNSDGDAKGDACDNCPFTSNLFQTDSDGDGAGNACDTDDDNDGILDEADNCPGNFNPAQTNTDGDLRGDACDLDDDGDGVFDFADAFPLDPNESVDTDRDGTGDNADVDDDNDGMTDAFETTHQLNPLDPADAGLDPDGDGLSNLEEFLQARNPRVNESALIQIINAIVLDD